MKISATHSFLPYPRCLRLVLAVWLTLPAWLGVSQEAVFPILKDDFAARPTIILDLDPALPYANSLSGSAFGSNSNATIQAGEPYLEGISSGQTVWGTWTPPTKGLLTLSPSAETFSPLLTVYTGDSLPSLSLVASNTYEICYSDGDCGCHWRETNQITFFVTRGQPCQICLDSAIITDASWVTEQLPQGTLPNGPYQPDSYWVPNVEGPQISAFYVVQQTTNILSGDPFELDFSFIPSPQNDDFTNAFKLTGPHIFLMATNMAATKEPGEPDHQGNTGGSSVWYSWTAPAAGRVTLTTNYIPIYSPPASGDGGDYGYYGVSTTTVYGGNRPGNAGIEIYISFVPTCGTEIYQDPPPPPPPFYPLLGIYTGTNVAALTSVNPVSMQLAAYPGALEFNAIKGQTYKIACDGNLGSTGIIPLYLDLTTPAVNSAFAGRIFLHGVSIVATGYNAGAVVQTGGPVLAGSTGKNAWWTWRAPVSGPVTLDLSGSDYAYPLGVFAGSTLAGLKRVATNTESLTFTAVQGMTYQIAVGDTQGLAGGINIRLQAPIVDLVLLKKGIAREGTQITYSSPNHVVAGLLSSTDGVNWNLVETKVASGNEVRFLVQTPPTQNGPFYRAIIFDLATFEGEK
jgi:hypothetical protein